MPNRLPLALALGVTLALGVAGCGNSCQDLGDRLCGCVSEGQIRTSCQNNVKSRVKSSSAGGSVEAYCQGLLASCPDPNGSLETCAWMLNTCPGKVACGLALPAPGGGDGCTNIDVPALLSPADGS